jgi:amino acid permease
MAENPSSPENNHNSSSNEMPSAAREEKASKEKTILSMEAGSTATIDSDDQLLMSLGYRPELKREFSYLTVFGQSFGAMGIAPAIAESIIFSLGSAGAVGMVWTYLVGCLLLIPVALSLGELGSSMPTAGGLYYVSAAKAPFMFTVSDPTTVGSKIDP